LFTQKRVFLCVCFLLAGSFFAVSASAQTPASEAGYKLTPSGSTDYGSGGGLALQSLPQGPQELTGTNATGFSREKVDPILSYAVHDVAVHDDGTDQDPTSTVIKKEITKVVTDPSSIVSKLPATLTVRTAALLELHAMRESAVDLCIQLPTKYRTHLPECAEIFKDEIRLERLAKDHP
jgi:hypothetical protein